MVCMKSLFTTKDLFTPQPKRHRLRWMRRHDLPHFKTIHAFCMRQNHMRTTEIINQGHRVELADMLGLEITQSFSKVEESFYGMKQGDIMFQLMDLSRNWLTRPVEALLESTETTAMEFDQFSRSYAEYKKRNGLHDFTDMLTRFVDKPNVPENIRIVIVDEAQDLSDLQWNVIFKVVEGARVDELIVAGDDDQAIYEWNGANVQQFMGMRKDEERILNQS